MEIKSFRKKNSNCYELLLTDNNKINLYDNTIINFNLLAHKKIDSKKFEEILTFNSKQDAYYKAIKYLSIKLRTNKEITQYLQKKNFSSSIIEETIKRLTKEGYLNETIYLKAYLNDQINLTLKGPNLIIQDLKKLGFQEKQFQDLIDGIDTVVWDERIQKIMAKKIKSNHNLSPKMLEEKIKKYLLNQGYNRSLIAKAIDNMPNFDEQPILEQEFQKEYRKLKKKYQGYELKNKIKANLYRKGFAVSNLDNLLINIEEK